MGGAGSLLSIPLVTRKEGVPVLLVESLDEASSCGIAHAATVYKLTTEI